MNNSSCYSSSSRTVEVTVLSAEDLRIDGRSVKKNTFAVVTIDPFNHGETKIDGLGGSYPSWDEKLVMNLPLHVRFMTLQVQCRKSLVDKLVGIAKLPVSDFIGSYVPEDHSNFLSYLLRDPGGNRSGIINVSVRVMVPGNAARSFLQASVPETKVPGYECSPQQKFGIPVGKNFDGTVTGIPVWNLNQ